MEKLSRKRENKRMIILDACLPLNNKIIGGILALLGIKILFSSNNILKTLSRSLIPTDFSYYRTGSRVWFDYYRRYTRLVIHRIGS